jgi:hypothetical protein
MTQRTWCAADGEHTMMGAMLDAVLDRTILFSFDRSGFLRHAGRFGPGDLDVDLTGRVCVVTGANSGIWRISKRLAGVAPASDDPRSAPA